MGKSIFSSRIAYLIFFRCLSENELKGEIPKEICTLPKLHTLFVLQDKLFYSY